MGEAYPAFTVDCNTVTITIDSPMDKKTYLENYLNARVSAQFFGTSCTPENTDRIIDAFKEQMDPLINAGYLTVDNADQWFFNYREYTEYLRSKYRPVALTTEIDEVDDEI